MRGSRVLQPRRHAPKHANIDPHRVGGVLHSRRLRPSHQPARPPCTCCRRTMRVWRLSSNGRVDRNALIEGTSLSAPHRLPSSSRPVRRSRPYCVVARLGPANTFRSVECMRIPVLTPHTTCLALRLVASLRVNLRVQTQKACCRASLSNPPACRCSYVPTDCG